ncbi:MAG: NAD-dependent epimerase/dehydratase family protein [Caldilineaceae bacterium]|nr:NAD-dependent epimerase/dehydratase family protein [Caldilineaceae bacterium]MCB0127714.1 NAD-dependent epimerase/dehydratase family protein [Caldilineaceae bacterium]
MRIGVTGGSGAIGRYVCDELLTAGHEVVSLDRMPPAGAIGGTAGYIEVDLRDLEASCAALAGFDQVVHLAAIPDPYNDPPVQVISVNTAINYAVFEALRVNQIPRVIYGCSDSSTGFGIHNATLKPLYVPIDEEHPLWPHESYSLSKHFGERMAETYAKAYGLEALSLRYNWVWVQRWYEKAARVVATARNEELGSDEVWVGGYISVRDVARAVLAASNYRFPAEQEVCYEAFFFTAANTSYGVPTLELLKAIYGEVPPLKEADYYERNPYASVYDLRKAERLLGWTPRDRWQAFEQFEF